MDRPGTNSPANSSTLLNKRVAAFLIIFLLVLKIAKDITLSAIPTRASDLTVENILQAVNTERQLRNLVTLNTDSRLTAAAEYKSRDMITRNYFAHVDPDGNYIWKKIESLGYTPYSQLGENLAIEFYSTDSLMNAWMNSPTHRANILQAGFRDQGAGIALGSAGQYHSAIANTFGALIVEAAKTAPLPPPPVAPVPPPAKTAPLTPAKKQNAILPAPVKPPPAPAELVPLPSTASSTAVSLLKPREEYAFQTASGAVQSLFALPTQTPPTFRSSAPVFSGVTEAGGIKKYFEVNRIFILIFGLVLLFILARDSREAYQKRLDFLDKKMNNLVLLFIALVTIVLLYWL